MKALAWTLGGMLAVATWSSPAAGLDLTFDDVASVGNPFVTSVETYGYRVAGPALQTIDTPGATLVDSGSAVYLAQTGIGAGGGLTLQRLDGAPFALYEFSAAGLYAAGAGVSNATLVALLGTRAGGTELSAVYDLGTAIGFVYLPVPTTWSDLELVTFRGLVAGGSAGALALDDIGVGSGPDAVPEPATLVMALTTAAGLGGILLRRRRS